MLSFCVSIRISIKDKNTRFCEHISLKYALELDGTSGKRGVMSPWNTHLAELADPPKVLPLKNAIALQYFDEIIIFIIILLLNLLTEIFEM